MKLENENIEQPQKPQLNIGAVISSFCVGDTVRFINKREFYSSTRIGSKGFILKSANSILGVCHWIKFKSHENWMYEDQIERW